MFDKKLGGGGSGLGCGLEQAPLNPLGNGGSTLKRRDVQHLENVLHFFCHKKVI